MSGNTIEYLIRLKDEFTAKMQGAASVGQKGGAAIAQGMAVAVAAGLKFKDQISAGWDVLNGNYEALGTVLGALPGPLGEIGQIAGETLGKMIKDTEDAAEGYRKLSAATGSSVEFLSGFKEAADDVRVSGEAVDSALTKFARGLGGVKDASDGVAENGKGIAASLADIGVNANDAEGKVRPLADILPDVANAFSRMADGPQKTALAIQLFGKQGAELIPILNKGKEGLGEMMKAAEEAGLTMSGKTVAAVDKLKQAQDQLGDSWGALSRKIGTAAIPMLTSMVDSVNRLTGSSGTMSEAFQIVNTELEKFYMVGRVTDDGMKKIAATGANGVEVLKRFAEGGAGSNAVTQQWATNLLAAHPELEKLAVEGDKAAQSTELLANAQKKAAEGSVEYKDKTQQLTDAMSKRDTQLDDINKKEKDLAEAYQKGFISSTQYAQGQAHLQDQTAKVKDEFDKAAGKIHDGADATERMDKAAQGAADRERAYEQATRDAAKAAEELKSKTDNLTDGFGKLPEKMDAAAKAAMAWKLATGQISATDAEQTLVAQGLTQAYVKHKLSLEDMIKIGQQYRTGEITGEQALQQAGAWKDPAFINAAKGYREVEKASGTATQSEIEHADYIKVTTRILTQKKASVDDLAYAQVYLNKANEADAKTLKQAKADMDAKLITETQYQAVVINTGIAHDKLATATSKLETAVKNGTVTTTGATSITDTWNKHLADLGLTVDKTGKIVEAMPSQKDIKITGDTKGLDDPKKEVEMLKSDADKGATVKVGSDTAGLTEPIKTAKADAEKPITVPVEYKLNNAPSFGTDKTSPNASMTLPVAFDTSGLDKQAAAVKDELTKLGPAGISISLDTVSFDQTLLRVKTDLAAVPDKSISIGTSAPLGGFTNSSITVSVIGDTESATKAIKAVVDTVIPEKVAFINGDSMGAMTILDAVNNATVKGKTLVIEGAHKAALGAESGSGGKTFAMDAIGEVNNAFIPLKTLIIAGDNTHAMGAIANTKNAMDSLKDKTVYLTVVNRIINEKVDDNGGGGGNGNGKDNRLPSNSVRDSNRTIVYLAQNLYVRDDMDLSALQRTVKDFVDVRMAEVISR
mgnify:CR=1 FL=1